jgi:hypothetical protein
VEAAQKVEGEDVVCRLSVVESEGEGLRLRADEGTSRFMQSTGWQRCSSKRLSRGFSGGSRREKSHSHCALNYAACSVVESGATLN